MSELRGEGEQRTAAKLSQALPVYKPWSLHRVSPSSPHSHMHSFRSAKATTPAHFSSRSPAVAFTDLCPIQEHDDQLEHPAEKRSSPRGDNNLGQVAQCSPCSSTRTARPEARLAFSLDSFPRSSSRGLYSGACGNDVEETRPKTASLWDVHGQVGFIAVSYTHLTLPTKLSV